jgi:hypothetical protein
MKYADAFPTNFYKAADLPPEGLVLTIASISTETMPEGAERRCLSFQEGTKKLTLNRTNWVKVSELTGKDDDSLWTGHRIRLVKQRVLFKGDMVDAIRLAPPDVPF